MELFADAFEGLIVKEFKGRFTDCDKICCCIVFRAFGRFFRCGVSLYCEDVPLFVIGEDIVPVLPVKDTCPAGRDEGYPCAPEIVFTL